MEIQSLIAQEKAKCRIRHDGTNFMFNSPHKQILKIKNQPTNSQLSFTATTSITLTSTGDLHAVHKENYEVNTEEFWAVRSQILIMEYVGRFTEVCIRDWSLISRSSYHFLKENLSKIDLQTSSHKL